MLYTNRALEIISIFITFLHICSLIERQEIKQERIFTLSKEQLITLIEKKREELIQIASKNGLSSNIAITHSQELDELLNEYNRVYIKKIPAH
jgi:hypothetical protein